VRYLPSDLFSRGFDNAGQLQYLGNDGLARDISLQNLLVYSLRQASLDQIAHLINNQVTNRILGLGEEVEPGSIQ
jgi:hypothetical protein